MSEVVRVGSEVSYYSCMERDYGQTVVRTKLVRINDNIQTGVKYMKVLLFKRLYTAGLA